MSLALELDDRLRRLDSVVASERLNRHEREEALDELLRAVESSVESELLASVLLLSPATSA